MKKKILLTIGSITMAIAPISTIIACSPGSSMGKPESEFLEALKSNDGIRKINNIWLDKALNQLYENKTADIQADLKKYIKFFIAEEIRKNNDYLTKLQENWAKELSDTTGNRTLRDKLQTDYAMTQSYHTLGLWTRELQNNSKTFDNFINKYLFGGIISGNTDKLGELYPISKKTDFLVNVKKALIVKKYLEINKSDWISVFGDEKKDKLYDSDYNSNSKVWDLIDDKEFPLILEGMRKHYAYSWNFKTSDKNEVANLLNEKRYASWGRDFDRETDGTYVYTVGSSKYNDVVFTINVTGNSGKALDDATVNISPIADIAGTLTGSDNAYSFEYDASIVPPLTSPSPSYSPTTVDTATKAEIEEALKGMVSSASGESFKGSWGRAFDTKTNGTYVYTISSDKNHQYNDVVFTIDVKGNSGTALDDATVTPSAISGVKEQPSQVASTKNAYSFEYDASSGKDTATKDDIEKALKSMVDGATPPNAEEIASEFNNKNGKLGKLSFRSEEIIRAFNKPNDPDFPNDDYFAVDMSNPWNDYIGFQGITTLPQGKGLLDFSWNDFKTWESKTDPDDFYGFVKDSRLKKGDDIIKYAEPGSSEINLTLFNGKGLIPTYDSTDKKIKFKILSTSPTPIEEDRKENLYWTFIYQNKNLYEKAVQYYTNKTNPIQLDASGDKYLEKQLIDMGIKFIKKPE